MRKTKTKTKAKKTLARRKAPVRYIMITQPDDDHDGGGTIFGSLSQALEWFNWAEEMDDTGKRYLCKILKASDGL